MVCAGYTLWNCSLCQLGSDRLARTPVVTTAITSISGLLADVLSKIAGGSGAADAGPLGSVPALLPATVVEQMSVRPAE